MNILSFTQNSRHKIFVAYDLLINNPLQECTRLCNFLDEHCEKAGQDFRKRLDSMLPRVAKNQKHQNYKKFLAEMPQSTREQRALYDFLRVKILYPDETFNIEDFGLYPGWREYLQSIDALMILQGAKDM